LVLSINKGLSIGLKASKVPEGGRKKES
jgi:hypothetical protein